MKQLLTILCLFALLYSALAQCPEDALEPNNAIDEASTITLPYLNRNLTGCINESDYFTFTAQSNGVLQVQLDFLNGDLDLVLFSEQQVKLMESLSNLDIYEALSTRVTAGTTYILQVLVYKATTINSTYTLDIKIGNNCTADALEPNDNATMASPLVSGARLANLFLCDTNVPIDTDWYKFTLNDTNYFELIITYPATPYATNLDIFLFDSNMNNISRTDLRRFDFPAYLNGTLAAGTYYAQVTQNIFVWDTPYSILLNVGTINRQDTTPTSQTVATSQTSASTSASVSTTVTSSNSAIATSSSATSSSSSSSSSATSSTTQPQTSQENILSSATTAVVHFALMLAVVRLL